MGNRDTPTEEKTTEIREQVVQGDGEMQMMMSLWNSTASKAPVWSWTPHLMAQADQSSHNIAEKDAQP